MTGNLTLQITLNLGAGLSRKQSLEQKLLKQFPQHPPGFAALLHVILTYSLDAATLAAELLQDRNVEAERRHRDKDIITTCFGLAMCHKISHGVDE